MNQSLLKGLCLTLKEFLNKWDKVILEGKKTFESIANLVTELRIIAARKDNNFEIYTNVCQDLIKDKSIEIVKLLNTLGERLEILAKLDEAFSQQTTNIVNTLLKGYEAPKKDEDTEALLFKFNEVAQNSQVIKVMITNEVKLKRQILKEMTELILKEEVTIEKFNECKFLLQLWTFGPYIQDSLIDQTLELISKL